jgi:hypothetical protein
VKSARSWAIDWPIVVLLLGLATSVVWRFGPMLQGKIDQGLTWRVGTAALLLVAAASLLPLQMLRLALKVRPRVPDWKTALAYGVLTMIGKWANVAGQRRYRRDRAAGRNTRLIEYKACATPITKPT